MDTQLIEKMTAAFEKVFEDADYQTKDISPLSRQVAHEAMRAAAEVQQQDILAEIGGRLTYEELKTHADLHAILAARIAKYKAPKERVTVEPVEIQVPSDQRVKRTVHRVLLDGNIIVFEHADEQYAKAVAQIERERMKAGGK